MGAAAAALSSSLLGDDPFPVFAAFLLGTAAFFGIIWAVSAIIVARVHVEPAAHRLRVRGREYPFSSLRFATRSHINQRMAVYLIYRFTLDDGRRFRVIASGRPFRGLTLQGFDLLRAMVQGSALDEPAGLSPHEQLARSTSQRNRGAVPVGRQALLHEIDTLRTLSTRPLNQRFSR